VHGENGDAIGKTITTVPDETTVTSASEKQQPTTTSVEMPLSELQVEACNNAVWEEHVCQLQELNVVPLADCCKYCASAVFSFFPFSLPFLFPSLLAHQKYLLMSCPLVKENERTLQEASRVAFDLRLFMHLWATFEETVGGVNNSCMA